MIPYAVVAKNNACWHKGPNYDDGNFRVTWLQCHPGEKHDSKVNDVHQTNYSNTQITNNVIFRREIQSFSEAVNVNPN